VLSSECVQAFRSSQKAGEQTCRVLRKACVLPYECAQAFSFDLTAGAQWEFHGMGDLWLYVVLFVVLIKTRIFELQLVCRLVLTISSKFDANTTS
jgi:hypothetical protein